MVVFEEKIVSPLTVRFSQTKIRDEFQNGMQVQKTIEALSLIDAKDAGVLLVNN